MLNVKRRLMVVTRKKIVVETDNSNWQAPKKRKPRKPMSEEQRVSAAARLEKAREKRKAKNPDYGLSGIHESIRDLPDEHPVAPKKVKRWINTQKELAAAERSAVRQKIKGALAKQLYHEGYIKQMTIYLKTGDWISMFYGEYQQSKVRWRCYSLAYDENGDPKRDVGIFYPDMGCVYTQEMFNEEQGISNVGSGKRKRSTRTVAKDKKKSKTA